MVSQCPGAVTAFCNEVLKLHLGKKPPHMAVVQTGLGSELYRRPSTPIGKGCG